MITDGEGLGREPGLHPLVELGDVVLAGHQHAPGPVGPRRHAGLGGLAGLEVLPIHPVEQFHRAAQVAPDSTTPGRYSQSHSTIVRSTASGYIRWKMTWSGTKLMKTWGRMVMA